MRLALLALSAICSAAPLLQQRQSSTVTGISTGAPAKLVTQCVTNGTWCVDHTESAPERRRAVTVDDGPYLWEQQLITLFNQYNSSSDATVLAAQLNRTNTTTVPLTHFVNGQNWGCIYDRAEDMQASFVRRRDEQALTRCRSLDTISAYISGITSTHRPCRLISSSPTLPPSSARSSRSSACSRIYSAFVRSCAFRADV